MAFVLNAAVSLSCIFSYTSFFGNIADKTMSALHENDDAMFFGKLIALHYMSIPINSCEVIMTYNIFNSIKYFMCKNYPYSFIVL